MANITEKNEYPENIPLIEKGEAVEGGVDGVDNRAPTLLTHRTNWLKNRIEEVKDGVQSGAVFITDITPQVATDNVGEKIKSEDGYSLKSCSTTSNKVTVVVTGITGHTNYKPKITVAGSVVTLVGKQDSPLWTGQVNITLPAVSDDGFIHIEARHEDGATNETLVKFDTAPVLSEAVFVEGYPVGQTELKAGDMFNVKFTADIDVIACEIEDSGAFVYTKGSFAAAKTKILTGIVVADRGNVVSTQGFRIRVQKSTGSWSNWYDSKSVGSVDGVNTVKLNNLKPTITFGTVVYPGTQQALRYADKATVNHTITNFDTVDYTSSVLTVTLPTAFEAAKVVSSSTGDYNMSTKNLTVKAVRKANGGSTTNSVVVATANGSPIVEATFPAARLRSGGKNGTAVQRHTVKLTSDQILISTPSVNAPEGTWAPEDWVSDASKLVWTRVLLISDDNAKGQFNLNSLKATGPSGEVSTALSGIPTYTIGGFVFRSIKVAAWPNREADIGTKVTDPTKLRCSNLGKGSSGSLNFGYQANLNNTVNKFTITGPTGVLNNAGNLWYNLDSANATSNTGGILTIEIEEVV